ncbi:hypothetical protein BT96DRAFT_316812 [Gymnopus androsaceus JB14]|uniref:mRNA stability protein n=1 Tax=Gymnopus androsaceus JB14 TaxID=1447944 RepID=A0A6A4I743_9AGAR|nr:hypothetical protein BT96DRAFT_316812 [Gymnopus androsaceus JB14]
MLPAKRNKVDISKLSEQEQLLFAKYGKLPTHKNTLMKVQRDRKYFDSGDYALSKAGVTSEESVGTAIPNPDNIPHASSPSNGSMQSLSTSPTNPTSPINKERSEASEAPEETEQAAPSVGDDDAMNTTE